MNRKELIDAVANDTEASKAAVGRILDSMTRHVVDAVARGDSVRLAGFGTFERADVAEKKGRHPITGEPIQIPATVRPRFVPGAAFKAQVKS